MQQQEVSAERATRVLMLVDEPIEFDRRVRLFSDRYRARGMQVDVLDVLRDRPGPPTLSQTVAAVWQTFGFVMRSVAPHVGGMRQRVRRMLAGTSCHAYQELPLLRFAGLSLNETIGTYFRGARASGSLRGYSALHANDLRCALFAAGVSANLPLVYDSHEFNPFRNRKNMSWFRILASCVFEAAAVHRAGCVVAVSPPIAEAFRNLYLNDQAVVLENRFYDKMSAEPAPAPSVPTANINLVYFGSLNTGRGLELLNRLARHGDISVTAFAYGGHTERARDIRRNLESITVIDQNDPHSLAFPVELLNHRSLSWCVLEDVSLSYTFALPNKFFQSLTLGLPIIASQGTYLGDLVSEHRIGLVIDPTASVTEIEEKLDVLGADQYDGMRNATRQLAQAYAARPVEMTADKCIASVLG